MQSKKTYMRPIPSSLLQKSNKKYVPTPDEANIIINYFLHNNFQDFNTWQQISKSRCEFQYNEPKPDTFQCKVSLKWDDASMPMIVQIGLSRNKKNAKKKALHKLIQNLIFLGLIGYGFKQHDFIKKLPKRRKQSSSEESQDNLTIGAQDKKFEYFLSVKNYQGCLSLLTYKNFEKLLCLSLKQQNLIRFIQILRKLQNLQNQQNLNTNLNSEDLQDGQWQSYTQKNTTNPFQQDLAQELKYQQLVIPQKCGNVQKSEQKRGHRMELACEKLSSAEGKISFQFFHPIEFKLIFRRNLQQSETQSQVKERSDYFNDFYKDIQLPKFQNEDLLIPLPYKVIQKFFNIILEFSYNYRLVVNLLSIFEREVTLCQLDANSKPQNQRFFLNHLGLVTIEFAYLLHKKIQMSSLSIQGLINVQNDGTLNFTSKEPQQIFVKKISKKLNTNQIQQMQEFANEEYILLVSKIDQQIIYIGQILQCWPSIKIRCRSFETGDERQKLPFTLYKIANGKLYNRLTRSITHTAKTGLQKLKQNSFLIQQKPTQPLLTVICELLAQWMALMETVLVVSENFAEIYAYLVDKGFKVAKITQKIDERSIIRKQIVCCSPAGVCADAIKNYAFTRVIVEGAQRISEAMSTLALDKGYKKIYFIGDLQLPSSLVLTKYAKNRNMAKSLFERLVKSGVETYNFDQTMEPNYFDVSILEFLNRFVYSRKLNKMCGFESPSIKGFPWPSQTERIAFIQIRQKHNGSHILVQQVEMCCEIVANVLRSGFIAMNEIACRVTSANARSLLTSSLYNMLKKHSDCGVNPDLAIKSIDFVSGSKFQQRVLCILIGDPNEFNIKHLVAGLQEGRRGFIALADFEQLGSKPEWVEVLRYANENKLILTKKADN